MGRSAKLHKRVPKKAKSSSNPTPTSIQPAQTQQLQAAKKKSNLKEKVKASTMRKEGEHVLGGADYVSLMMGGRKKAREEATKLPRDG